MDKVLITHTDLDGVTCAILFKALWPEGTVCFEDYKTINERLKTMMSEHPEATVFITDISPKNDPYLIVDMHERGNIMLIDHHKTAMYLNDFSWAWVEEGKCGAHMFSYWIYKNHEKDFEKIGDYADLVYHANDYDLWKHENPHSKQINSLLWILGRDRFIERFLNNPDLNVAPRRMQIHLFYQGVRNKWRTADHSCLENYRKRELPRHPNGAMKG